MGQNYKIFFRRHVLVFGNPDDYDGQADAVISSMSKTGIKALFSHLRKLKKGRKILFTQAGGYVKFQDYFKTVVAAGGGVFNPKGDLLLIHRLGNWDLPKGKLEKGEAADKGALREVEEECNVRALQILKPLRTTLHIYFQKKWMIKKTHWYVMHSDDYKKAAPQYEEDIDAVKWVNIETLDIEQILTYTSIREVLYELQQYAADTVSNRLRVI